MPDLTTPWSTFWIAAQAMATGLTLAVLVWQVIGLQKQIRVMRETSGYDLLLRLDARYDSARVRQYRAKSARVLADALEMIARPRSEVPDSFWKDHARHVERVLDEFELIALLEGEGVVDSDAVWTMFSYQIINYHDCCTRTGFIIWVQQDDSTFYAGFTDLYEAMQKIQSDKPDPRFLEQELVA